LSHRVSFPSNYSKFVVPDGKSSVLAEITCNKEDEIWKMSDLAIIDRVTEELHALQILNKRDICFAECKRTEFAYVINDLNHGRNMKLLRNYLRAVGIDFVGRFAEFEYINMDGCVRRSIDYVRKYIGKKNSRINGVRS
jgi:protoporphyrinogen oxidase